MKKKCNVLAAVMAGVMCVTLLCSCQSNAKSGINKETMFARDFIKVQRDKFSVGLGAPGDLSNRYTIDDLASVTQLDTALTKTVTSNCTVRKE